MSSKKNKNGESKNYKVVVIGPGGVGKSALTVQLVREKFLDYYDPTIEDSYRKDIDVDGNIIALDIVDTAGQEDYVGVRNYNMKNAQGFIMVYSIIDARSFADMPRFYEYCQMAKNARTVPLVICGNKKDMEANRQVSFEEAKKLADSWGAPLLETSAKLRLNVEEAFKQVVREIEKMFPPPPPKSTRCTLL